MTLILTKLAKYKVVIAIVATLLLSIGLMPNNVSAQTDPLDTFGIGPDAIGTDFVLGGDTPITETIASIIGVALSLLGIVALVIILTGGFKWMTSGGAEDKVSEARKLIFAGIIGLAIILSAYSISIFVLSRLSEATGSGVVTLP